MKITIELKNEDEQDKKIINFITDHLKSMKEIDSKQALSQDSILRHLINKPTELHKEKLRKSFLANISEETRLDLIYKSYKRDKSLNISLADFSLNHLTQIKKQQRVNYLNSYNFGDSTKLADNKRNTHV